MFDKTLRWLIEDMRPFRSVETPAFREVCDAGVQLPSSPPSLFFLAFFSTRFFLTVLLCLSVACS